MHNIDIASLLRDALTHSGCSDQQIGTFDGHSTIELEMAELPSINIGIIDDGLWFWSSLIEISDMLLAHRSEELLRFLMGGFAFARTEQMQLVEASGMLEVRVMLADSAYVSAEALADAVEAYLAALTTLCELVR
ncbi:Type III secretion system protein BsaR [Pseudomonas chlororaphis subsp. piscium]|uniref:InvB/SpaK family type III secretion system chaperone n=1 Tax=Pseudomonas chlororaphis TaxID=587753 RepID=UPI000F567AED|nr:Invasion protein B family [Pseudomonas chlororaphis]AZC51699.1 Type III secretion system protein BsaR [Pseudomonas chlororaphis subsp. piscium]